MLADKLHYEFHTIELEDQQLYDRLLTATYYQDEPLMHLSEPHLLAISQIAKPSVKVLLSGEGADELMGGYVRYKPLQFPTLLHSISANCEHRFVWLKSHVLTSCARYGQIKKQSRFDPVQRLKHLSRRHQSGCIGISQIAKKRTTANRFMRTLNYLYPGNLRRQALYFDQHTYLCSLLDRNDRCTMGASIECREPFLDQRLVAGFGIARRQMACLPAKKENTSSKLRCSSVCPTKSSNSVKSGSVRLGRDYFTDKSRSLRTSWNRF